MIHASLYDFAVLFARKKKKHVNDSKHAEQTQHEEGFF